MPLATDFRTKMMYNNFMYGLAGCIAEKLTGDTWENLIKDRFFDILGMKDAVFIDKVKDEDMANFAKPHMTIKGQLQQIDTDVHR